MSTSHWIIKHNYNRNKSQCSLSNFFWKEIYLNWFIFRISRNTENWHWDFFCQGISYYTHIYFPRTYKTAKNHYIITNFTSNFWYICYSIFYKSDIFMNVLIPLLKRTSFPDNPILTCKTKDPPVHHEKKQKGNKCLWLWT